MTSIFLGDPMDSHPSQLHSQWALIKGRGCLLPRTMISLPSYPSGSVTKTRLARCLSSGHPGAPGISAAATVGAACNRGVGPVRTATPALAAAW